MFENIDDITINYTEEGVQLVKELDKEVLTRGPWSTIMYRYQDWDPKAGAYKPEKYTVRRYRKRGGEYKQMSKFNISGKEQAGQIVEILKKWADNQE